METLPEWLWSIVVGVIVVGLVAALRNADRERIKEISADVSKLEGRVEQRWSEKDRQDRDWRHDTYSPAIDAINARLLPLAQQMSEMERRMERVERVLNGRLREHDER